MKEQSYQIKKEIQSSLTEKVNPLSNKTQSMQTSKQRNAAEIQKMNVENYSQFLKQYRMTVKPPLKDEEAEIIFCERFDKRIIHKSLQVLNDFIKQQKRRQATQRKQQSEHKTQNSQYKVQKKMSNVEQNSKQAQNYQQQRKTMHVVMDKIILYTWQLSNIRTIVSCSASSKSSFQKLLFSFHRLCIMTSRIYVSKWGIRHVTLQAMQITYFNMLKNKKFSPDPDQNGSICCLIEALLGDTEMEDCGKYINIYNKSFLDIQGTQISYENQTGNNEKIQRGIMNCQRSTQKNHFCKFSPSPNKQLQKSPQQKTNLAQQKRTKEKSDKKSSVQLELEWFIYIIQFCINNSDSFIKLAYTQLSNGNIHLVTHSAVSFMHFISLLLNKIINDRKTTEIVRGYVCPIQQVRNMYNGSSVEGNSAIDIKISWSDFEWVCQSLLKELYCKYKEQISKVWRGRNLQHQNEEYDSSYIQCIMNILGIINCCNFLGGYNAQLQIRTTKLVMKFGLQFLELTYLIYQLSHAKKRKITLNSADGEEKIKNQFARNLQKILDIQQGKPNEDDFEISLVKIDQNSEKTLNQQYPTQKRASQNNSKQPNDFFELLPIQEGQIVAILRMLCNLVHINQQAQKYFQENLKYFRIVMSLTHENDKQLTMKNWAIVFLKNAAQRSVIMREQLQKLKIDIKVDEGNNLFM